MRYQIISPHRIDSNGLSIPAGQSIATIESDFDASQLESLIQYKQASIVGFVVVAAPVETSTPATETQEPDTVVATDTAEDVTTDSAVRVTIAESEFPGLETRLALAIIDSGIESPEALRAKIDDGYDIIDIDGIGKKTKPKVLEWIDKILPSS